MTLPEHPWIPSDEAAALVASFDLSPHPEGGWFRRTWTAPTQVMTAGGERATASGILFLLDDGQEAAWHKVVSDELWLWHGPAALEIHLGGCGNEPLEDTTPTLLRGLERSAVTTPPHAQDVFVRDGAHTKLAAPDKAAALVQLLVPAGTWQRTFARGGVALATCIVSPEFRFEDWQLA